MLAGGTDVMDGFVSAGADGVVTGAGVFLLAAVFTVTLQVSFFFPIIACTFADPFFCPLIVTAAFPFFFIVMFVFPDVTFHFTFFFVFFTFSVLLFPFVMVSFLLLRLIFFAADTPVEAVVPNNKEKAREQASSFLFVLISVGSSF